MALRQYALPGNQRPPALPRLLRSRPSFTVRLLVMLSIANLIIGRLLE